MPSRIATSGTGIPNRLIRNCGFDPVALSPTTDAPAAQGVCTVAQGVAETLRRDASRWHAPSLTDAFTPALRSRIGALVETAKAKKNYSQS